MTTTFFPMRAEERVRNRLLMLSARGSGRVRRARQVRELPEIQREACRGTRPTERLADAVVAAAVADRRGLARRVHRKDRTAVVMVAAQVAEIDVQRVDAWLARLGE